MGCLFALSLKKNVYFIYLFIWLYRVFSFPPLISLFIFGFAGSLLLHMGFLYFWWAGATLRRGAKASLVVSFHSFDPPKWTSLVAQTVKCLPTVRETYVWSLGREDPLEKAMAAHSSTLAWKIPWTEEHGRLQSMGLQRVRHDFIFLDPPKFCILMDANLSFFFPFCLVILVS